MSTLSLVDLSSTMVMVRILLSRKKKNTEKVGTFLIIDNFVGLFLNLYGRSMVAI